MNLKTEKAMIFLGVRQFNSIKGNLITMVKLADAEKFENFEFFIDPNQVNVSHVIVNTPVIATFELTKFNNNNDLRLLGVETYVAADEKVPAGVK